MLLSTYLGQSLLHAACPASLQFLHFWRSVSPDVMVHSEVRWFSAHVPQVSSLFGHLKAMCELEGCWHLRHLVGSGSSEFASRRFPAFDGYAKSDHFIGTFPRCSCDDTEDSSPSWVVSGDRFDPFGLHHGAWAEVTPFLYFPEV